MGFFTLHHWTRDDYRLMVVLLLTAVYPMFVLSFFPVYMFVVLPGTLNPGMSRAAAHHAGFYHYYWLFAALLWALLCAVILPCFRDVMGKKDEEIGMQVKDGPAYPTKQTAIQPFVHIEDGTDDSTHQRCSVLTNRTKSSESLDNNAGEEKKEKESLKESRESLKKSRESLKKSRESLKKSCSSLEREKITQSGEFLDKIMGSIESGESKDMQDVVTCEVHVSEKEEHEGERASVEEEMGEKTPEEPTEPGEGKKGDSSSSASSEFEIVEPAVVEEQAQKQQAEIPSYIEEADIIEEEKGEAFEEVPGLEEAPQLRQKARPTIDTSRASGYHRISMPTPLSADALKGPETNMVFLFVNPEAAPTADSVLVDHPDDADTETA